LKIVIEELKINNQTQKWNLDQCSN